MVNYIIAIGLMQALLAAALLWQRGFSGEGDLILLALMLCIAAHLGIKFSIYTVVADDAVRAQMNTCVGFCYGPLLLMYRDAILGHNRARRWYLFIPFAMALIGYLTVISVLTVSADIGHVVLRRYNIGTLFLIPVLNMLCSWFTLRQLPSDRSGEGHLLRKLGLLLLAGSVIPMVLSGIQAATGALNDVPLRSLAYLIIAAMPMTLIWELAGLRKTRPDVTGHEDSIAALSAPSAYTQAVELTEPHSFVEPSTVKALTEVEQVAMTAALEKVEDVLNNPEFISDPELNLERLANGAGLSRHQLSEMLNRFAGQSFYDFVNSRRIRRTTQKMADLVAREIPVNILILAFDNGFKAKSSFNAAFKKFTAMTPSEYLDRLRTGSAMLSTS